MRKGGEEEEQKIVAYSFKKQLNKASDVYMK